MDSLTTLSLTDFATYLKKDKFKNKLKVLALELREDSHGIYIQLMNVQVKKSQCCMGYGSAVLSEIINIADEYNVRIKLWAVDIYGSDLKRLKGFYSKHGFIKINNDISGNMIYFPNKRK